MEQVHARLQSDPPKGAGGQQRPRRADFETVMRVVEQIKGERRESFWNRYGDEGRDLVLCRARECCGLTLKELGEAAGGLRLTTVSEAVRRFQRQMQKDGNLAARFAQAVSTLWNV